MWVGEGRERGWKGSMGCSGNGTPLLPGGRGRMSGDVQADVDSVEGPRREGGCVVRACFLFCCGRRGACPSLPWVLLVGFLVAVMERMGGEERDRRWG